MDLIKLYKKRRYIIKTAVLVLIIIIAGIFYINPTKEDGSVIINIIFQIRKVIARVLSVELPAAVLLILTIVMVLMVTKQAMTDWMRITVRYMYIYVVQLLMQELSVVVQV